MYSEIQAVRVKTWIKKRKKKRKKPEIFLPGETKEIELTQGKTALVDEEDYKRLRKFNWFARFDPNANTWYASRTVHRRTLQMHRLIMNAEDGQQVDHINHDGLDNRKENLRVVTNAQNSMNRRLSSANTSGYKGVHFDRRKGRWQATIEKDGKKFYLGYFVSPILAALAYDDAAKELFEEYAYLNFAPERDPINMIRRLHFPNGVPNIQNSNCLNF